MRCRNRRRSSSSLLMVSGFDKYFQIVRCFRDEDLRADRQPEFTQIDLEMSFPQEEQIFEVIEPLVKRVCEVAGFEGKTPFPRLSYAEAMRSYGSDKPDRRVPPMHPAEDLFPDLTAHGLPFMAIHIPKTGALSRKERDELKGFGTERGLRVFDDPKRLDRDFPEAMAKVRERTGAAEDDLLLLAAWAGEPKGHRPEETVYQACGQLRLFAAQKYNDRHKLLDPKKFEFLWVMDFPMFEWDEEGQRWNAAHHPFTSVHDDDLEKLTSDPARCRAKSYDLVLNGVELGSGSIRIHRRDVQSEGLRGPGIHAGGGASPLWIPPRRARIRRSAARWHRAGSRPPCNDSGRRDFDSRRDSFPQDRAGHGPDVRRAVDGTRAPVEGAGYCAEKPQ